MSSLLSYALTTVDDVKELLGIASSDHSKDNLITRKINQATRQIEAYCGRRFKETTYTQEGYTASNTNQLVLRQRPITSFTSLEARDSSLNEDDFETLDANLYFANNSAGVLDLNFNASGSWGRYRVSYSAGYATIPEDLAEACATLAAYYTDNPSGTLVGVAEKQEGSRRVKFNNTANSFNSIMSQLGLDLILDTYSNYPIITDR
jgi:uncharacterized phiE125 gp8 family phage protein